CGCSIAAIWSLIRSFWRFQSATWSVLGCGLWVSTLIACSRLRCRARRASIRSCSVMAPPDLVDRLRHCSARMLTPLALWLQAACRIPDMGRDLFHQGRQREGVEPLGRRCDETIGHGLWSLSNPDAKRQIEMGKAVPD